MLAGSMVALVTPFDRREDLDREAFERLPGFHLDAGTDAIVVGGHYWGIAYSKRRRARDNGSNGGRKTGWPYPGDRRQRDEFHPVERGHVNKEWRRAPTPASW